MRSKIIGHFGVIHILTRTWKDQMLFKFISNIVNQKTSVKLPKYYKPMGISICKSRIFYSVSQNWSLPKIKSSSNITSRKLAIIMQKLRYCDCLSPHYQMEGELYILPHCLLRKLERGQLFIDFIWIYYFIYNK